MLGPRREDWTEWACLNRLALRGVPVLAHEWAARAAGLRARRLLRAGDVVARAIVLAFFDEALDDARWRPFRSPWSPEAVGSAVTRLLPALVVAVDVALREAGALDDQLERQALELRALEL